VHDRVRASSHAARLIANGKPKMVARVAAMRKMIVTRNAMLRDGVDFTQSEALTA
jgi:hypothetical protein